MVQLNRESFRHFWVIAKIYFWGNEKYSALGQLLVLGILLIIYTALGVVLNTQQGNIISGLAAKAPTRFWRAILEFVIILAIYAPLLASFNYISDRLGNSWRKNLSRNFISKYLENQSFYHLCSHQELDNPDQRIAEDIKGFTQGSLSLFLNTLSSIFQIIAFSSVLWRIYQPLFFLIIIYSFVGNFVTWVVFAKPLFRLRFEKIKKEANFRSGLIHIRENAESIAFYSGESYERKTANKLFQEVFDNFNSLIAWQLVLNLLSNIYSFIPYILPAVIMAPQVFSGKLEVGKVSESVGALISIFSGLNFIVQQFDSLTSFAVGIERLQSFLLFLEKPHQDKIKSPIISQSDTQTKLVTKIETIYDKQLTIEKLTLLTPEGSRTLLRDLSLELETGKGLLVIGASGCGKSSLLRAIAGLWNSGTGKITRPKPDEIIFLPQQPYMTFDSLYNQLVYPNIHLEIDDEYLHSVLEQVNLLYLIEQFGDLKTKLSWSDILSLGEQQRVAFARIFINKPEYVILDEATSALDINNENQLYHHLSKSGVTYISVGHRTNLEKYHQLVLNIMGDEKWEFKQLVN
jgi:putative ATP-binding cassette transporter